MNIKFPPIAVSPRWALASFSCVLGKFELSTDVEKTSNWHLQVNGSYYDDDKGDDSTQLQQVNVLRILKYPQVPFATVGVELGV